MAKRIKQLSNPVFNEPLTIKSLGEAIRARRTQSQLRLEDAAALCNVAKQTFTDVEHGKGSNQINTILQICSGLGIKLCILPWPTDSETENDWY